MTNHGIYLGSNTNQGWFLRVVGWRQLLLLSLGLACSYWLGYWRGGA